MVRRRGNTDAFSLFSFQDIITSVTGIMILVTLLFSLELTRKHPQMAAQSTSAPDQSVPTVDDLQKQLDALQKVFDENQAMLERIAAIPAIEIADLEQTLKERLASLEAFSQEIVSANNHLQEEATASTITEDLTKETLKSLEDELKRLQEEIASTSKTAVVVYNPDPGATKSAWLVDLGGNSIQVFAIEGEGTRSFALSAPGAVPNAFVDWARQRNSSQEYFVLLLRPESIELYDKLQPMLEGMGFDLGFDLIDSGTNAQSSLSVK